jgi:AbrB family looped-hinge helix DNA binding protein
MITIVKYGRTTIPAAIRRQHDIQDGDRLVWLDNGRQIIVIPASDDPIKALRGRGHGEKLVERLLTSRKQERK